MNVVLPFSYRNLWVYTFSPPDSIEIFGYIRFCPPAEKFKLRHCAFHIPESSIPQSTLV
uniref:Uncharacterized protein n=1 Tax=Helianthus annuus TaxID=4232 RepID=A0A251U9W8_HELAN